MMDYFSQLSTLVNGRIKKQKFRDPHIQGNSVQKLNIKDFKGWEVEINDFPNFYSLMFKGEFNLAFSINVPDRLFIYDKPLKIPGFSKTIFARDTVENFFLTEYNEKYLRDFLRFVEQLKLEDDEGVFYYKNGILFVIRKKRDVFDFLTMTTSILQKKQLGDTQRENININSANVPIIVQHLTTLAYEFGITDDNKRNEMRGMLSKKKKKELINAVYPFIENINKYLDSFKNDRLSDEAIKFGALAEFITELMVEK